MRGPVGLSAAMAAAESTRGCLSPAVRCPEVALRGPVRRSPWVWVYRWPGKVTR